MSETTGTTPNDPEDVTARTDAEAHGGPTMSEMAAGGTGATDAADPTSGSSTSAGGGTSTGAGSPTSTSTGAGTSTGAAAGGTSTAAGGTSTAAGTQTSTSAGAGGSTDATAGTTKSAAARLREVAESADLDDFADQAKRVTGEWTEKVKEEYRKRPGVVIGAAVAGIVVLGAISRALRRRR